MYPAHCKYIFCLFIYLMDHESLTNWITNQNTNTPVVSMVSPLLYNPLYLDHFHYKTTKFSPKAWSCVLMSLYFKTKSQCKTTCPMSGLKREGPLYCWYIIPHIHPDPPRQESTVYQMVTWFSLKNMLPWRIIQSHTTYTYPVWPLQHCLLTGRGYP